MGTGITNAPPKQYIENVEDMDVYKKAYSVSLDVHKRSLQFPKIEQYAIADQIRRASKSICANLAEGFEKQFASKAEFRRFVLMALGSSGEMRTWSNYCKDLGYIELSTWQHWREEYSAISKMLRKLRFG